MKKTLRNLSIGLTFVAVLASCGGKKAEISEKGKQLMGKTWMYDINGNLKAGQDKVEDSTGIKSGIELQGDVKTMGDFAATKFVFGTDKSDESKLSYSQKIGSGLLSTGVVGYWEISGDTLTLKEWDSNKGEEKAPKQRLITELTDEKLVWTCLEDGKSEIYIKK